MKENDSYKNVFTMLIKINEDMVKIGRFVPNAKQKLFYQINK